jgi:hypothetical protein
LPRTSDGGIPFVLPESLPMDHWMPTEAHQDVYQEDQNAQTKDHLHYLKEWFRDAYPAYKPHDEGEDNPADHELDDEIQRVLAADRSFG